MLFGTLMFVLCPKPSWPRKMYSSTSTMMISRTTASTPPPPPPPPVSTTVVCSRSTSSRSSAIGNSPTIILLLWRNEPWRTRFRTRGGDMKPTIAIVPLILVAGCQQQPAHESNVVNQRAPAPEAPAANVAEPAPQANQAANVTLPDDRTPLPEPKGPIDPKSAEAAGQVVQHYGALIEQGRWTESWKLWSSPDSAKQFDRNWRQDSEVHMEIGKPGDTEGAAGSIYTTVPVVFY